MKIKTLRWALAVLACAGLSGLAIADEDGKTEKPEGKKERPERPVRGGDRPGGGERGGFFKAMDGDGDGKVTKKEFKAFHMKRLDEMFARLDGDDDGVVTQEEAAKAMQGRGGPGAGRTGGDRPEGGERRRPGGEGGGERKGRPASE